MAWIIGFLIVIALYCFGEWLFVSFFALRGRFNEEWAQTYTYRVGLCGIVALGFAGLMLK